MRQLRRMLQRVLCERPLHGALTTHPVALARKTEALHQRYGPRSFSLDTRSALVPHGSHAYEPSSEGVDFKSLGALLGSCAAQYRNPSGKPLLESAKLGQGY